MNVVLLMAVVFIVGIIVAIRNEHAELAHICNTFIPGQKINLKLRSKIFHEDVGKDHDILGLYDHSAKTITLAMTGNYKDRQIVLFHELGHAATFYIEDIDKYMIIDLYMNFLDINIHEYGKCGWFWHLSHTTEYACTSFMEDVAETYANIARPHIKWHKQTLAKARLICELFKRFDVPCEL
jgi:hypothetical protein